MPGAWDLMPSGHKPHYLDNSSQAIIREPGQRIPSISAIPEQEPLVGEKKGDCPIMFMAASPQLR